MTNWSFVLLSSLDIRHSSFTSHVRIFLQTVPNHLVQFLAHRFATNAVDDFAGKGMDQHAPGGLKPDSARAQIKNRVLVQLADGCSVRAFHVIGVNLELR